MSSVWEMARRAIAEKLSSFQEYNVWLTVALKEGVNRVGGRALDRNRVEQAFLVFKDLGALVVGVDNEVVGVEYKIIIKRWSRSFELRGY